MVKLKESPESLSINQMSQIPLSTFKDEKLATLCSNIHWLWSPNFGSMQQFWIEFKKFFFKLLVRFLRLEMWYACQKLRETILCNQPKKDLTRREQPERETELRFPIIAPAPVEWQEGPPRSERGKAARMQDLLRANRPAIRSGKMHTNLTRGSSNQSFRIADSIIW